MNKDWSFKYEHYSCGVRVNGVLLKNGCIFLQREKGGEEYAVPGGQLKIGETLEEALIREYHEEAGAKIFCRRLLWTEECFWEYNGTHMHTLNFYYLIDAENYAVFPERGSFVPQGDNPNIELGFVPLKNLSNMTVYPRFLEKELLCIGEIKHFITKE